MREFQKVPGLQLATHAARVLLKHCIIILLERGGVVRLDGGPYTKGPKGFFQVSLFYAEELSSFNDAQSPELWLGARGHRIFGWPAGLPPLNADHWPAPAIYAVCVMLLNGSISIEPEREVERKVYREPNCKSSVADLLFQKVISFGASRNSKNTSISAAKPTFVDSKESRLQNKDMTPRHASSSALKGQFAIKLKIFQDLTLQIYDRKRLHRGHQPAAAIQSIV